MATIECRWCGRDLPDGAHHRRRYCPDRDCRTRSRHAAKRTRKRTRKTAVGASRVVAGRQLVYNPDHPIAAPSGWVGANRAALYDILDGAAPACRCCGEQLDWAATNGPTRVCATRQDGHLVALCRACLAGVSTAGTMIGHHLSPTSWAEVGGSYGAPIEDGGPHNRALTADHQEMGRLAAAVDRLADIWDGTIADARFLAAAATVLDLKARRGV